MGLINIYNTISNEHKEIKGNGYLKNLLPGYNLKNCEIIKAGEKIGENYEVQNDDIIYLRVTPKGLTTALIVGLAVTGTALLAGAIVGGVYLAKQNKKTKEAMEKAQRDAANLAQQIDTKPYIKGAKNKSAIGSLIQYQIGRIYNTPCTLSDGSITITGDRGGKQFYNINFCLGYGDLEVEKILIGNEPILENASGIPSGQHDFLNTSPYYDSENFLELRQPGEEYENDEFKYKTILTQDGNELKHDHDPGNDASAEDNGGVPLIKQVSDNTKKLEVCIQFNGLRIYNDKLSTWEKRKATVRPYWSNDGGATWNEFYFSGMTDNTIEINTKETIRFIATKEFEPQEVLEENADGELIPKSILLKVVKTTPKAESNSNEECYLMYYQSYCYDAKKSDLTGLVNCLALEDEFKNKLTRLGLRIKAAENTDGVLDDIHVIASAKAPIFINNSWSTEKYKTSNPAAIIYEVLTSDKHRASQFAAEEFDRDDLGELYNYCEDMGYSCNAIITSATKKIDIIDNILKACNATLYRQDGVLHFAIDKIEPLPVALINAENIKNISYSKQLKRKPDGVKVTYLNGNTWQNDTFYMMLDGRNYKTESDTVTEMALDYVTDYKHAAKLALRNLKELILQPRVITAGVGKCGDRYPLYSVVLLQYKEFRQGLRSSSINKLITNSNGDIIGITVSDYISVYTSLEFRYGVIIQAVTESGSKLFYKEINFDKKLNPLLTTRGKLRTNNGILNVVKPGEMKTRILYFNDPILASEEIKPELYNSVSIGLLGENGEFDTITNKMKITEINPDGNGGFNLTLKDYNPEIYTTGKIPPYVSNLTPPTKQGREIPQNANITVNPAATADAKAAIYEETGLNKLESVEITETNEETGETTIKADLIKGAQGVFDDITANRGFYNEITVEKAKLENTLLKLSNRINLSFDSNLTDSDIMRELEAVRAAIYEKYGNFSGFVNGCGSFGTSCTIDKINGFALCSPTSAISLGISETRLYINFSKALILNKVSNKFDFGNMYFTYEKNSYWNFNTDGNFICNYPDEEYTNWEFVIDLRF